jgi:glutamate-1-semialdehyde 2,1-aminomutase
VLLIFDEVVTGFRLAYGGAQEYYRVTPDLVAYGKALGGGYPIGVFGGRADIMAWVEESRMGRGDYVWMASTLGGNPVSAAAANAALSVFRQPETYGRLHALGRTFREMLSDCLASKKVVGQILGDGPLAQIVFSERPVFDYRSGRTAGAARSRPVMLGLFRRRMFVNPMGTKLYLSLAHDEAACEAFCDSLSAVLDETG